MVPHRRFNTASETRPGVEKCNYPKRSTLREILSRSCRREFRRDFGASNDAWWAIIGSLANRLSALGVDRGGDNWQYIQNESTEILSLLCPWQDCHAGSNLDWENSCRRLALPFGGSTVKAGATKEICRKEAVRKMNHESDKGIFSGACSKLTWIGKTWDKIRRRNQRDATKESLLKFWSLWTK